MAVCRNSLLGNVGIRSVQAPNQHIDAHWLGNADLNALQTRLVEPGCRHEADAKATPARRRLEQAEFARKRHFKIADGKIKPCVVHYLFHLQKAGSRENTDAKALHDPSGHIERRFFRKQKKCGEDVPRREMSVT